jgi:methyltransferase (TIGR00027 family)
VKRTQSSITAAGIAVARAVESEKPDSVRICYDPYAVKFLHPIFYQFTRFFIVSGYTDRNGAGVTGFLVARCRTMDELLQENLDEGLQQLVILGAGYDSRAYRFEQLKKGVKVFEVDHPATQAIKMKKVESIFKKLPKYVTYVSIDFTQETLGDKLQENGFNEGMKTLFIWEGVVMYLNQQAVESTLDFIVHHSGSGSQVIFDYIYTSLLDGSVRHGEVSRMRRARRFSGEGLTFSFTEAAVADFLHARGFTQVTDLSSKDLHQRYFHGPNAKRKVAWGYGIASGVVP